MITVRVASGADAEAIQAIYEPVVLGTPISFEEVPPSVEDMRGRILATLETYPYLVAEHEGRVIGYAYASLCWSNFSGHPDRWKIHLSRSCS